jgi:hypothetical protein
VERGLNLRKGVFQVPMLVGKGKRGPNLLEARSVFAFSQKPVGLQGGRERKTPWIETCGRRPCEKRPPGPLVGRQTICGQVSAARSFEEIGE